MKRVFFASLIGAIVCFLWGSISWMLLDWHDSTMQSFTDEGKVAEVLRENAPQPGLYLLPGLIQKSSRAPTAASQEAAKRREMEHAAGPFAYAVIRPGPKLANMGLSMGYSFARSLAACFIIGLLLHQTSRLDYIQKVGFCVLCGLFAGLATDVPMLIWFEAPLRLTLVNMADHLCEWLLAGLAIGAIVQGREGY